MILLEKKKICAKELAEMFEVTPRTIYRDINAINMAGIPIVSYPGYDGGIGIMENYKVDKSLFTTSDIISLLTGLQSISSAVSDKEIINTLTKVRSMIPAEQFKNIELKSNQITIDLTSWAGNRDLQFNLEKIKHALNENKYISFYYSPGSGGKSYRKVEPYQVVLKETNWYLQGYCTSRKDFRIFKLTRISKLESVNEVFTPQEFIPKPLDGSGWIEKRIITIKLLIDESLREQIAERCNEEDIESLGNKKLLASIPFTEDESGYNLLLSFGDKCECLEPDHVRKEIVHRIKKLLSVYDQ